MIKRSRVLVLACGCLGGAVLGISGCSSSSSPSASAGTATQSSTTSAATTAATAPQPGGSVATGGGATQSAAPGGGATDVAIPGQPDLNAICPKLPVADAQALIRATLPAAVSDPRLGGCTFVLPGNALNDNNLTVGIAVGDDATSRYSDDVKGVFSAGGSTISVGPGVTTPLPGVGDKAVWGSNAGYPTVSALKGDVYCTVSTADDGTQLTIIGSANNPLPQGTSAQQAQYAQLEGKLCVDLFGLVH
jgi:hypothetical protein